MHQLKLHSEEQLLGELRSGDEAGAFSEIYNRYWERLFAIAFNRTRHLTGAQDIVQDVFLSLWKNRQKSEIVSLPAYLATAVKYTTLAWLRNNGRISIVEFPQHEQEGHSPVDDYVHHREILRRLQMEEDRLPEKCRLIFRFSRHEGLSSQEIAERLNISHRTVETQISKALRLLRTRFKKGLRLFF